MSVFKRLEFLPDKFEQRVKPFSGVVSDFKLETLDSGRTLIVVEFGEDEAPLKINLGYPDKWVENNGGMTPKPGTPIYKFLKSLSNLGVDIDINDDITEIKTIPSLLGKTCSFDVKSNTFEAASEVDEEGKAKVITFYVWTLTKVVDGTITAQKVATAKPAVAVQKPVAAPTAPTAQGKPAEIVGAADLEQIKKTWLEIISKITDEKFQFPLLIKTKCQHLSDRVLNEVEKQYYNDMTKAKEILAELETEGYIEKVGPEFKKNTDAVFLALA